MRTPVLVLLVKAETTRAQATKGTYSNMNFGGTAFPPGIIGDLPFGDVVTVGDKVIFVPAVRTRPPPHSHAIRTLQP